jgi:hypothetical protein
MRLSTGMTLLFGAMAGVCSEVVTYPLEVIRRKMQLERTLAIQSFIGTGGRHIGLAMVRLSLQEFTCQRHSEAAVAAAACVIRQAFSCVVAAFYK